MSSGPLVVAPAYVGVDQKDRDLAPTVTYRLSLNTAEFARMTGTVRRLLVWTGIDFRLTPDGRYVFLEANPNPMFLGFEDRCGLPLTDALANLLLDAEA